MRQRILLTEDIAYDRLEKMKDSLTDRIPNAKTICFFREQLTKAGLVGPFPKLFDGFIRQCGLEAHKGNH